MILGRRTNMPPGKHCRKFAEATDSHSKRSTSSDSYGWTMPPQKCRRLSALPSQMKKRKNDFNSDGYAYIDIAVKTRKRVGKLPSVASKESINYKESRIFGPKIYLFLDIETSGFSTKFSEILQIAAVTSCLQMKQFNQYLLPTMNISLRASEINHLTASGNQLLYKGERVDAVEKRQGLNRFLKYL